ncbi:MAG: hypothetical protein JRJ58_12705 [Deltaproteobacteria bacterium]|nr:hypothetical protein [Deltaproteobacteria bacterium]MBW2719982.1 hypothetical protein [Deltaproteobacteria bacterium]
MHNGPANLRDGERVPDEIQMALPHLDEREILESLELFAHEYVRRFSGSPESILAVTKAATDGAASGYGEAIEHGGRQPETG